jgi:hypothetical protein
VGKEVITEDVDEYSENIDEDSDLEIVGSEGDFALFMPLRN